MRTAPGTYAAAAAAVSLALALALALALSACGTLKQGPGSGRRTRPGTRRSCGT
jgi:hypothetical protein